jgi:hypothetical protein
MPSGSALVLDGAAVDGAAVDGAAVDGAGVDGAAVDGAAVDGAAVDGAAVDGAAVDAVAVKDRAETVGLAGCTVELVEAAGVLVVVQPATVTVADASRVRQTTARRTVLGCHAVS